MGDQHAAITIAAILQRSDQINNAGGYLRSLTDRARDGKFSTWPMIMALVRAKLDAAKPGNGGGGKRPAGDAGATSDLKVSPALLKTLKDPKFR
jgi:replication initiation protein RepC